MSCYLGLYASIRAGCQELWHWRRFTCQCYRVRRVRAHLVNISMVLGADS